MRADTERLERESEAVASFMSVRKALNAEIGSYNDRNDGFARTYLSRNKSNRSRIYKHKHRRKKGAASAVTSLALPR